MAAVGPLLGGALTTAFSWRWAFGVNVPFGILVIIGVLLWLQNVLRYDALQTGLILLSLAIGSFLASGFSRRLAPVVLLRIGVALELTAVLALALTLRPDSGWLLLAVLLFVYGIGLGLASAQITNVVLADVPVEESGSASGTQSTSRQVGSALGIAILGTLLFSSLSLHLSDGLADLDAGQRDQLVNAVTDSAGAAIPGLLDSPATAEVGRIAAEAFTGAAASAAFGAAAFLAIALIASFFLGRKPVEVTATP